MVGRCIRERRLIRSTEANTATPKVCGAPRPGGRLHAEINPSRGYHDQRGGVPFRDRRDFEGPALSGRGSASAGPRFLPSFI